MHPCAMRKAIQELFDASLHFMEQPGKGKRKIPGSKHRFRWQTEIDIDAPGQNRAKHDQGRHKIFPNRGIEMLSFRPCNAWKAQDGCFLEQGGNPDEQVRRRLRL